MLLCRILMPARARTHAVSQIKEEKNDRRGFLKLICSPLKDEWCVAAFAARRKHRGVLLSRRSHLQLAAADGNGAGPVKGRRVQLD